MPNPNLENTDLRSEEVQDILTRVPHWMIRWGSLLFLLLIIMFLFISWFVKYPDIVNSTAFITTKVPPQKEFAKLTGKFDSIFVSDGQKVYPNQTLAVIENSARYQDVYKLKSILDTIRLKNDNFEFPIDELPILLLGEVESDYALFENSYIAYKLNKDLNPYSNEAFANKVSLSELKVRLRNLKLQEEINQVELKVKKKDLDRHDDLYEKGVISAQEFENKQLEYLNAKRNFKNNLASISQLRESISDAQKISKSTIIKSKREEMTLLKKVVQTFHQLKNSIKNWELSYVLSSEIEGKVSFLTYWSKNQTVNQGDLVFTVIPSQSSSIIARLKTPAQNSGKIEVGQKVNISLQNYPETEFGFLKGKVKSISNLPNKNGLYIVDVSLPQELITSYGQEINFKQEMTGTANIITEDLRLMERFFYQLKDVFNR
ncbi:HlyD family secretion protein [Christiangramia sp. SM2212]|uniref:HlyD family efflux transporter periplasmic adaptor subunit n=1 Tax=Christiangramia sediminicola TaxID=3073267 RepID=A0ABU1ESG0_9FLAO|nr:HlyD family efflux transporter periplasmic adaptor subunit [Christiangramia sp. SM2212]MDR5591103.1 HlyD family efflux transporter periplasmic adaptor subunit [Christiangramia sp. SM2212]